MPKTSHQKKRNDEIHFIGSALTPTNPKDVFYKNTDELIRQYLMVALIGSMMIIYMLFS